MTAIRTDISDFILHNVEGHSNDIVPLVADKFNISRQRAHHFVQKEIKKGNVLQIGRTRATRYFLVRGKNIQFELRITPQLAEDQVWIKYVKPMILKHPDNIYRICHYGFTEIVNNAIDHSEGKVMYVEVKITNKNIEFDIMDNGIGIFKKIQNALHLESDRESILHLSKGKFTTDPSRHTGEGIFFTSRIVDKFSILSGDLYYAFRDEDWFLSPEKKEDIGHGTGIRMTVSLSSKKTPKQIMDKYTYQEIGFGKTIVAVALSTDPKDPHVSRSQAKRLLMGLDKFKTVVLNFEGVESIGQAFVDQIFRVFQNEHPHIKFKVINTTKEVNEMIERGRKK
jgi:anti-sigma regulatory factor (Ser/Thr protein kinase)